MAHSVTLMPGGQSFQVDDNETVLTAALRQGITLPYGCRDGACGACKGKIVEGEVDYGDSQVSALTDADRKQGLALFCCARPTDDLRVECQEVGGLSGIPVKTMPARIQRMRRLAPDVMAIELKLPTSERLQFLAGQYVDILLKDGRRRSFSIANAPHDDEFLHLHIRHVPGGVFTEQVFATMKERDILRINGPLGTFHLRDDSTKPVVLVAGGTGFAPIKAIVEQAIHGGSRRPMTLYWGARTPTDLYMNELPMSWADAHAHIRYVPVVSDATATASWAGRTGLVHHAVMEDFPDLSGHQVYACGAPAMIDAARSDFAARCGLQSGDFFADSFSFSADAPAG